MPQRDDDPIHPNFDGIQFQAVTDKRGVIVIPASGNTQLVASYLSVGEGNALVDQITKLIDLLHEGDPKSYAAEFFERIAEDLISALADCEAP